MYNYYYYMLYIYICSSNHVCDQVGAGVHFWNLTEINMQFIPGLTYEILVTIGVFLYLACHMDLKVEGRLDPPLVEMRLAGNVGNVMHFCFRTS